jgi:hypothetical protein
MNGERSAKQAEILLMAAPLKLGGFRPVFWTFSEREESLSVAERVPQIYTDYTDKKYAPRPRYCR